MTISAIITTRFADDSTRSVTINNLEASGSGAANLKVRLKYFDVSVFNGIYVGKDGVSNPTKIDSAKTISEVSTLVWTKDGGLQ